MPRPPAAKSDEPTKTFIVRHGFMITDNDGKQRIGKGTLPAKGDIEGNDLIELTYEQAKYHRALNAIDVPLEDFSNEPAKNDTPQEAAGGEADGSGEPAVGTSSKDPFAPAKGKD